MATLQIPTARVFVPLLQPMRYKGAHGGRGSGKSHFFAEKLVEKSLDRKIDAVCVREIQKSLDQSVKKLIESKIRKFGVESRFNCLKTHIECDTGGQIIFQGMQNHTAESIKSLEDYDVAWAEEAHTLSRTSFDILYPTIRAPGAELWFSWNAKKPTDPVDQFFRKENRSNAICVEANFRDNPWFPEDLREDMENDRARDPDKYAHIWGGGYVKLSHARVFHNWRVGSREEFDQLPDFSQARPYFGCDWGYSNDPTVLVRMRVIGRTIYIERESYKVGCEIDFSPFLFAGFDQEIIDKNKQAFAELPLKYKDKWTGLEGATRWPIIADNARPETISYMKRHGFPRMEAAAKGANSVMEGVDFIKTYNVVIHPDCQHVIDEFSLYSWQVDKHTQEILPLLEDKKNHVIDSVRYALEKMRSGAYDDSLGWVG